MTEHAERVAPEPYLSAYIALLESVLLQMRLATSGGESLSAERVRELNALADVAHVIPEFLLKYGSYFTPEMMRQRISDFDQRWGAQLGPILEHELNEVQRHT